MITLYEVVTNTDLIDFVEEVQDYLFNGWILHAGLIVRGDEYIQAVVQNMTEKEYAIYAETNK
jgi:hypothetical protein